MYRKMWVISVDITKQGLWNKFRVVLILAFTIHLETISARVVLSDKPSI